MDYFVAVPPFQETSTRTPPRLCAAPQERLNGQGHGRRGRNTEAFGESEAAKQKRGPARKRRRGGMMT